MMQNKDTDRLFTIILILIITLVLLINLLMAMGAFDHLILKG